MPLRKPSARPWSWEAVLARTLAVYRTEGGGRELTAVLIWQGDDRRVETAGRTPPLLAITVDAEHEAGADNRIAVAGFDSLEQARAHCVEWAKTATESAWDELGEAAQVGVYAAIREPGFANRG